MNLMTTGSLTPEEYALVKNHPEFTKTHLPEIWKKAMVPALLHNQRDSSGYPIRLQKNKLFTKHDVFGGATHALPGRVNDQSFMQDCNLEDPVFNANLAPHQSFVSSIPVINPPDNFGDSSYSFVTNHAVAVPGDAYPTNVCEDPQIPSGDIDLCKFLYPYGRTPMRTRTSEISELIEQACHGRYENFFFVGDLGFSDTRGVSNRPNVLTTDDRRLIIEAALRKEMADMGISLELQLGTDAWTGTPANDTAGGGGRYFWGMNNLIRNDWDTTGDFTGFLTASTGDQADCARLNSVVLDYGDNIVGDGTESIYQFVQSLELSVYNRSTYTRLNPVSWAFVMHPTMWDTLIQFWPCEFMADGCPTSSGADLVTNDGVQQSIRDEMRATQSLTVNGRTYPVLLDDYMVIEETAGAGSSFNYTSSIWMVPYTVRGDVPVLMMQHYDYTLTNPRFMERLAGIPEIEGLNLSAAWTDGGRYLMTLQQTNFCFQLHILTRPRMVFLAPHLAGRIDNVVVNYAVQYDLPAGMPNSTLL